MKLKKLLPLLDGLNRCKIFLPEEEKPIFEGYVSDVPWTLTDCKLDFSDGEEPVSVWYEQGPKNEIVFPYFNICIIEEENNETL